MPTKNITLSIPLELCEFLSSNPDLSPSKMFQAKCYEIMKQRKDFEQQLKIKDTIINQMGGYINSKKLWNDFQKWKTT